MDRFQAAIVVAVLLVAGAALYVYWQVEPIEEDPGRQRAQSIATLERHATVLRAFLDQQQRWPESIRELRGFSEGLGDDQRLTWASGAVPGGGIYQYQQPAPEAPADTVVMASPKAHEAVSAGALFDGEPSPSDRPAVYMVLRKDLTVERLDEAAHRRRASFVHPAADGAP